MQEKIKQRIHALVESIEDETKLQLLMEDVQTYLEGEEDNFTDEEMNKLEKMF